MVFSIHRAHLTVYIPVTDCPIVHRIKTEVDYNDATNANEMKSQLPFLASSTSTHLIRDISLKEKMSHFLLRERDIDSSVSKLE